MANKAKQTASDPTRHIPKEATLDLWVRSGGRCALCNEFLLEDKFSERRINLGERAHIAGWKEAEGSPRSTSEVPTDKRNEAANLILLCLPCHKIIDDKVLKKDYSEEQLLDLKHEHEERIHHLTAMARDRETTVLRLFGAVRGSLPEMARDYAIRTVIDGGGRYARFSLSVDKHSVEVDLSSLPDPEKVGAESYYRIGKAIIDQAAGRVAEAVHQKHVRHLSIFALARIPFLVYLGYVLDDKVPLDMYQKHRGDNEGWLWPDDAEPVEFEVICHRALEAPDVALVLSLSGTIPVDDLPAEVAGLSAFEIRPKAEVPNPNLFRTRKTLDNFSRAFQDFLARLEQTHKAANHLHLFPAVPITAAITCGRSIMRGVHPAMHVYDRLNREFEYALTVNEP